VSGPLPAERRPPLVSVVLPFFNARRFLSAAIDSIVAQDFRDFELLAVDDGSDDGSGKLVEQFVRRDPRVRLVRQGRNGLPGALNLGLKAMAGRYLARMDADDIALPNRFALQVTALEANKDLVVVGGGVDLIDARDRRVGEIWYPLTDALARKTLENGGCPFCHPAAMIRASALSKIGGYRAECELAEDLDLWLRLAQIGTLGNLDGKVLRYRIHRRSASFARIRTQISSYYRAMILNDPELPESVKAAAVQTRDIWRLVRMCTAEETAAQRLAENTAWYVEESIQSGADWTARRLIRQIVSAAPARYRADMAWQLGQHAVMAALSAGRTTSAWCHLALSFVALMAKRRLSAEKRGLQTLVAISGSSKLNCETTPDLPPSRPAKAGYLDLIQWRDGRRYLLIQGWIARQGGDPEVVLMVHLDRKPRRASVRRTLRPDVREVMGDGHLASGFICTVEFDEPVDESSLRLSASVRYRSGMWQLLEDANAAVDISGAASTSKWRNPVT